MISRTQLQTRLRFLHRIGVSPAALATPALFSLVATAFEGVSLAMLIPFLTGVLTNDFSFMAEVPGLSSIEQRLPVATASRGQLTAVLASVIGGAALIKNIARYAADVRVAALVKQVTHNLRQLVFDRCLGYGKLFFDRSSLGHLSTVLMNYTSQVTNPLPQAHQMISMVFSLAMYVTLMALISWPLALFVLLVFPLINVVLARIITRIKRVSRLQTGSINDLSKRVFNILSSVPLVKLYDFEAQERQRFADISQRVADLDYRIVKAQYLITPLQEVVALVTMLLVVGAMTVLARYGTTVSAGSFIVFFYLVLHSVTTYGRLQRFQSSLAHAAGPIDEIKKILSDTDKHVVPDGTLTLPPLRQSITCTNLHFAYDTATPVLQGVSFAIPARRVTALVGATGSGKTTIVSLLLRLYDCPPRSIFFDGTDIRDFTAASVRSRLAFVSQDAWLFNDTLWANLTYGLPAASETAVITALTRARLLELVERLPLGLQTEIGDRGVQLSGGEKQRLGIARALLKQAEIIIFDEPTSALDARTEQLVAAALAEAMAGRTVLVIAHRLATIQHADSIVVLDRGRVVEQGTWTELAGRHEGLFRTFWEAQMIRANA